MLVLPLQLVCSTPRSGALLPHLVQAESWKLVGSLAGSLLYSGEEGRLSAP